MSAITYSEVISGWPLGSAALAMSPLAGVPPGLMEPGKPWARTARALLRSPHVSADGRPQAGRLAAQRPLWSVRLPTRPE